MVSSTKVTIELDLFDIPDPHGFEIFEKLISLPNRKDDDMLKTVQRVLRKHCPGNYIVKGWRYPVQKDTVFVLFDVELEFPSEQDLTMFKFQWL